VEKKKKVAGWLFPSEKKKPGGFGKIKKRNGKGFCPGSPKLVGNSSPTGWAIKGGGGSRGSHPPKKIVFRWGGGEHIKPIMPKELIRGGKKKENKNGKLGKPVANGGTRMGRGGGGIKNGGGV